MKLPLWRSTYIHVTLGPPQLSFVPARDKYWPPILVPRTRSAFSLSSKKSIVTFSFTSKVLIKIPTMVKAKPEKVVLSQDSHEVVPHCSRSSQEEHDFHSRVKSGAHRLDKRSAQGVSGLPKKSGQGGKFTWGGNFREEALDNVPAALDENDPNYDDEDNSRGKLTPKAVKSATVAPTHQNIAR